MDGTAVLLDGYERIRGSVHDAVEGATSEELNARLDTGANSLAWLVWHLTRVQDDHIADVAELEQVWLAQSWQEVFGLPLPPSDTGFGHSPADVAAVHLDSTDTLLGYHDAVYEQTVAYLQDLDTATLDEVVDEGWDPPVTLGVRLVSVLADDLQHAGQAAFVRGVLRRQ